MPYLGFGPSAHSFDGNLVRRWNVANNMEYTKALTEGRQYWEEERLSPKDLYNEYVMLQLRRSEGLDLGLLKKLHPEFHALAAERLSHYVSTGHVLRAGDRCYLSPTGKLLCDRISMECFA
jgi:coproporphyrinogen III oxidase-like Fe-S oxidoreductase